MRFLHIVVLVFSTTMPATSFATWLQLVTDQGKYAVHSKVMVGDSNTSIDTYYTDAKGVFNLTGDPKKLHDSIVEYAGKQYRIEVADANLKGLHDYQIFTITERQ